jgi:hypothetical protein
LRVTASFKDAPDRTGFARREKAWRLTFRRSASGRKQTLKLLSECPLSALDDRIPKNHLLGRIDVFVTAALADLHEELEPYYSDIGRPSIDPELIH